MPHSGLIVRRTERFEISLPARVRVAAKHQDIVQFSKGVADVDRWIRVDVIDFAQGGVGFVTDMFFPRSLVLEIEISDMLDPDGAAMISCEMAVKRVQMTDRRPAYLVGCAFTELDEKTRSDIDTLLERLLGMGKADQGEEGSNA